MNTLDLRALEYMKSLWTYKVVTDRISYCDSGFVAPHGAVPGLLCAKCWENWEESQRILNDLVSANAVPFSDKQGINDPREAVDILFGKALPALPKLSEEEVYQLYEQLKSKWSSKILVKGTTSHVKEIVRVNVERLRQREGFNSMKVESFWELKCAQISVFYENYFMPVRIWSTADAVFACGNALFQA